MGRVAEYLREWCLGGAESVAEAVRRGRDPAEVARCFMRVLTIAPIIITRELQRAVAYHVAQAGIREYLGVATVGAEAPLIDADYIDVNGRRVTVWDDYQNPWSSIDANLDLHRAIHGATVSIADGILRYNGRDVRVVLQCQRWVRDVQWSFTGYVVRATLPPDAVADITVLYVRGVVCTGAYTATESGSAVGVGAAVGYFATGGDIGVRGHGVLVWLSDADGLAERFCWSTYCAQKQRGVKMYVFELETDAFQWSAQWSPEW